MMMMGAEAQGECNLVFMEVETHHLLCRGLNPKLCRHASTSECPSST